MNDKKRAVPGVAAPGDGGTDSAIWCGASSCWEDITRRSPLSSALPRGAANALPGREIQRLLGLRSLRDVSALVERERRAGVPVCASCDGHNPGYFLPATVDELERYVRSLRGRCREVSRTLEALEVVRDNWAGQLRFDGKEEGGEHVEKLICPLP